jgi:Folate-sensitive fragile site protein Fra10Ac1
MRWRIEKEVVVGKGQFICGAKGCESQANLHSYEVPFRYVEQGQTKNELVKVRVCVDCAKKLFHEKLQRMRNAEKKRQSSSSSSSATSSSSSQQQSSDSQEQLSGNTLTSHDEIIKQLFEIGVAAESKCDEGEDEAYQRRGHSSDHSTNRSPDESVSKQHSTQKRHRSEKEEGEGVEFHGREASRKKRTAGMSDRAATVDSGDDTFRDLLL